MTKLVLKVMDKLATSPQLGIVVVALASIALAAYAIYALLFVIQRGA